MNRNRFLNSKNWRDNFTSLNSIELKIIAIYALKDCPNNTCRKNKLYEYGIKFLQIRTSQTPKELFQKSFDKAILQLINYKVLKEYNKNKFPRICFRTNDIEFVLNEMLKKYFKGTEKKNAQNLLIKSKIDFPEFESNPKKDKEVLIDNAAYVETAKEDYDEDNFNILDQFDDDLPDIEANHNLKNDNNNIIDIQTDNVLFVIKNHFENRNGIKITEEFNELILRYDLDDLGFEIIIEADNLRNEINIKGYIDLYKDIVISILQYWAKIRINAAICIEDDHYLIRQSIDLKRYSQNEVISLIDNFIKAASKINSLIVRNL